jgi:hypothetical protein
MSNICTSYIRIKRRYGLGINANEQEMLFKSIVNVHNEFGSCWIMISKQYFTDEKCFDIQFGSGKRTQNIL